MILGTRRKPWTTEHVMMKRHANDTGPTMATMEFWSSATRPLVIVVGCGRRSLGRSGSSSELFVVADPSDADGGIIILFVDGLDVGRYVHWNGRIG
jgi:hypothetical protein